MPATRANAVVTALVSHLHSLPSSLLLTPLPRASQPLAATGMFPYTTSTLRKITFFFLLLNQLSCFQGLLLHRRRWSSRPSSPAFQTRQIEHLVRLAPTDPLPSLRRVLSSILRRPCRAFL